MTLHIFNPDTDYALASGSISYTPPAPVVALRRSRALFPACAARRGDAVLCLDPTDREALGVQPEWPRVCELGLHVYAPAPGGPRGGASYADVADGSPLPPPAEIRPWGWNAALRHHLLASGFDSALIPSEDSVAELRKLSHRRTTIPFNEMLASLPGCDGAVPAECFSADEAMEFMAENPGCWFKAPWSSSGRGVLCTDSLPEWRIRQWVEGIIRRQGSVMAETGADRALDFATEWTCRSGKAEFIGVSVFETSFRGKYHGNLYLSQSELEAHIKRAAPRWSGDITEAQREALDTLVSPHYEGPLGIDMLADTLGRIRSCVELNLRQTMGNILLWKNAED